MANEPNIFDFATSELSQDAFLAWIFSWSKKYYESINPELNKCALEILKLFLGEKDENFCVTDIEIWKQWEHIDLWITINKEIDLIIEDKVGTTEHSNQLERYKGIVEKWAETHSHKPICAYYKSHIVSKSEKKSVEDKGYAVIEAKQMLDIMEVYSEKIQNQIFIDYKTMLGKLTEQNKNFSNTLVSEWNEKNCFQGFFNYLNEENIVTGWGYVPNPNGGFIGAWTEWTNWKYNFSFFLQFENEKLCIKIGYNKDDKAQNQSAIRNEAYGLIVEKSESYNLGTDIDKPARFGVGNTMTVAVVNQNRWICTNNENLIDVDKTIQRIKKIKSFVEEIASKK